MHAIWNVARSPHSKDVSVALGPHQLHNTETVATLGPRRCRDDDDDEEEEDAAGIEWDRKVVKQAAGKRRFRQKTHLEASDLGAPDVARMHELYYRTHSNNPLLTPLPPWISSRSAF